MDSVKIEKKVKNKRAKVRLLFRLKRFRPFFNL